MNTILSIVLVALATFTIFAYLAFIWWLDRYEREPIWLVIVTFFWGAVGGTMLGGGFTMLLVDATSVLTDPTTTNLLATVFFAPAIEELTKALIFVFLIFSVHFDNETDGLIYGAATGLGFACVENLLYFSTSQSFEELASLVVLRTAFTALVHCVSSSLIGVTIGFARSRSLSFSATSFFVCLGYLFAVVNHATWNGLTMSAGELGADGGGAAAIITGILIVLGGAFMMFLLTQFSVFHEHKLIERVLKSEAGLGTIPTSHASIIPFWSKRKRKDWLNPKIERKKYIRLTTKLAFRKHKLEAFNHKEKKRQTLIKEMKYLREEIQGLLG